MRSLAVLSLAVLGTTAAFGAAPAEHFGLAVSFVAPAKPGADGAVAVTFTPKDPDVRVNQEPAPRLKLDPAQAVLVDKQPPPPTRLTPFDPATAKSLDPREPVRFPVALAAGASKGLHEVKASVTYFYCSKREGWCRKGSAELRVPVTVP